MRFVDEVVVGAVRAPGGWWASWLLREVPGPHRRPDRPSQPQTPHLVTRPMAIPVAERISEGGVVDTVADVEPCGDLSGAGRILFTPTTLPFVK